MTEKKSLVRVAFEGFFVSSFGDLSVKALGLAATFLILRNLDPYEYGLWQLSLSVLAAFGVFTLSSASGVVVADVARALGAGKERVAHAILVRTGTLYTALGVLAALLLALAAPFIVAFTHVEIQRYLYVLAATLFVAGLRQAYLILFQAYLEPLHAQLFKNIGSITYLIGIGVLVLMGGTGLYGIVVAYTLSTLVPVIIYFPHCFSRFTAAARNLDPGSFTFLNLWKEARWALAEDYASTAASSLWPWLVGYFIGVPEVGMISIAMTLMSQITSLMPLGYMLRSILPRMAFDSTRLHDWVRTSVRYSFWIHIIGGFGILIAALVLFPILFPKYILAIPIYALLLFCLPSRAPGILVEWFFAIRNQKAFFFCNAVPILGSLLILPLLLKYFGTNGFVVWQIIMVSSATIWCLAYFERKTGVRLTLSEVLLPSERDRELASRALTRARTMQSRSQ